MAKKILVGMNKEEIQQYVEYLEQPGYRGRQIADWIYKKSVLDFSEMKNISALFAKQLDETSRIHAGKIIDIAKSKDGTNKYLIGFDDGNAIEAVLLPYSDRISVCISTQVGCGVKCRFCATGINGFRRNLTAAEIIDEVLLLQHESGRRISHVVYMGMGEPLFNYENVLDSIYKLNNELEISMRRITVSTVGIIPRIKMLAKENIPITLAISLHAPNDDLRKRLIPIADKYPLDELIESCKLYVKQTGRRITFEYLLIKDVNDSISAAHELGKLLRSIMANVNIIPYNKVEGLPFSKPETKKIDMFKGILESVGLTVTQRMEKGQSVSAACGQLRLRNKFGGK